MANFLLALVNAELSLFGVQTADEPAVAPAAVGRTPRLRSIASITAARWADRASPHNTHQRRNRQVSRKNEPVRLYVRFLISLTRLRAKASVIDALPGRAARHLAGGRKHAGWQGKGIA